MTEAKTLLDRYLLAWIKPDPARRQDLAGDVVEHHNSARIPWRMTCPPRPPLFMIVASNWRM
jgi:hypothetical protein